MCHPLLSDGGKLVPEVLLVVAWTLWRVAEAVPEVAAFGRGSPGSRVIVAFDEAVEVIGRIAGGGLQGCADLSGGEAGLGC